MAPKRGSSGLSLLVGVNKPKGMTSHDVVNACRRIFGERRVGHTGTLDPMASGVLPVCIGPATRLDNYLVGHEKAYIATIRFGIGTDTDDAEGAVVEVAPVPKHLRDEGFAAVCIDSLKGVHEQMPPAYSAIKVGGKRAYSSARGGEAVELSAREVEILDSNLLSIDEVEDGVEWNVWLVVSKGTYIRAIARDIGRELGCPAHLSALERTRVGLISKDHCVSLDSLETLKTQAAIDPVRALGLRTVYADDFDKAVENGSALDADELVLYDAPPIDEETWTCACTSGVAESETPPNDGEIISVVVGNRLKGMYAYDEARGMYKPQCVFSVGVQRL